MKLDNDVWQCGFCKKILSLANEIPKLKTESSSKVCARCEEVIGKEFEFENRVKNYKKELQFAQDSVNFYSKQLKDAEDKLDKFKKHGFEEIYKDRKRAENLEGKG